MIELLRQFLELHPIIAPVIFIALRTVPIVIAPIPGLLFDVLGIAVFGWEFGFVLGLIGVNLGALGAFLIGRYFREPAVRRFASLRLVHEWEDRYSEKQKFWWLVGVRCITSSYFDYVSYAAGLTKMRLGNYIISTFLGTLPFMFLVYYLGGKSVVKGLPFVMLFFVVVFVLGAWISGHGKRFIEAVKRDMNAR
jgi:uncharacterized membrane protein YdjX (TVP38/TMEM64 family)